MTQHQPILTPEQENLVGKRRVIMQAWADYCGGTGKLVQLARAA